MDKFDDVIVSTDADGNVTVNADPTPAEILALGEKPKPAVNFTYPVRITNNAACSDADDAYRHAKLAHKAPDIEKEVQALGSPDGTMLFNVWMHEILATPELESEFGLVNYNFDLTAAP